MPRGLTPRQFAIDLRRFGDVTRDQAKLIFQKIVLELDTAIVLGTPVDEGRARGNWFPTINTPSVAVSDRKDKSGASTIAAAQGVATSLDLGDVAWFANNLPYILPLENGHSGQAPAGMVDLNLNAVAEHYGGSITR